jgi:acetylornithine deacetylase/succinyl-diaminopimelate desuccinylase-like protein
MDVISLTRKLLSFNTVNPPGNKEEITKFVGGILAGHGGPGQPEMAHQPDEFCSIDKLERAVNIYKNIILKWS